MHVFTTLMFLGMLFSLVASIGPAPYHTTSKKLTTTKTSTSSRKSSTASSSNKISVTSKKITTTTSSSKKTSTSSSKKASTSSTSSKKSSSSSKALTITTSTKKLSTSTARTTPVTSSSSKVTSTPKTSSSSSVPAPTTLKTLTTSISSSATSVDIVTSLLSSVLSEVSSLTSSIPVPVSSTPVVLCVPPAGNAVQNNGFGTGMLDPWAATAQGPAAYPYAVAPGYGVKVDDGNDIGFVSARPGEESLTVTLTQTVCVVPGVPYSYAYYAGLYGNINADFVTGCTLQFSVAGQILEAATPFCGDPNPPYVPGMGIGDCQFEGYQNDGVSYAHYFNQKAGTYTPLSDSVELSFLFNCVPTNEPGVYPPTLTFDNVIFQAGLP